jgi:hypothetical protein
MSKGTCDTSPSQTRLFTVFLTGASRYLSPHIARPHPTHGIQLLSFPNSNHIRLTKHPRLERYASDWPDRFYNMHDYTLMANDFIQSMMLKEQPARHTGERIFWSRVRMAESCGQDRWMEVVTMVWGTDYVLSIKWLSVAATGLASRHLETYGKSLMTGVSTKGLNDGEYIQPAAIDTGYYNTTCMEVSRRGSQEGSLDAPRTCTSCQTTQSPEWRRGPSGYKTQLLSDLVMWIDYAMRVDCAMRVRWPERLVGQAHRWGH